MELASLIIIAIIAVVLLLQVIALVQIAGVQKTLRELKETKAAPAPVPVPSADRFERKGGDFRRHEKRPYQDQRPRPQNQQQTPAPAATPVAAVDPVETSLRDINLRLKNAERDQEFARKKIQENLGDRDQNHRGHDRSDRGGDRYREGSERDGGRDRNRGGRDGNRDRNRNPRRDNWQQQGNRPPQQQSVAPAAIQNTGDELPTFENKAFAATPAVPFTAAAPVEQNAQVISVAPAATAFSPAPVQTAEQAPTDFGFGETEEGMEHGRKVLVKRRPLREESGEGSENQTVAKEETSADAPQGADIQFGRRKGL